MARFRPANAQATRLAGRTTTLAHEYARQGKDWETELCQRAKEVALMYELGLTAAQTAPRPSDGDDNDDEPEEEVTEASACR